MKKTLCLLISLLLSFSLVLVGCIGKNSVGNETENGDGLKAAISEKQRFSTKCRENAHVKWDDNDGLYIYTDYEGSIPYVLIYRYADETRSAEEFLKEDILPSMREDYGDDLIDATEVQEHSAGGRTLPGITFTYRVGDYTVKSLRLCLKLDGDIFNFTAKYIDGSPDEALDALDIAVENFKANGTSAGRESGTAEADTGADTEGVPDKEIKLVDYSDPSGYFTMKIPSGWTVRTGIKPNGEFDIISYAINVYDPAEPDNALYYNLNCTAGLKSQEAHDWYVKTYGEANLFAQLPILQDLTTRGFFESAAVPYGYTGFKVRKDYGATAFGGNLLYGEYDSNTGKKVEGMFTAALDDMTYYVQRDMFDYGKGTIDVWPVNAYTIITETAVDGGFKTLKPALDKCFASISFTDKFDSERREAWRQLNGTISYNLQRAEELSEYIASLWSDF